MPLYSATMKSCIEKKTEITKGGAVYNSTSFSLIGIGTFIDSLYAIKKTVFEDRKYTLEHLKEMIRYVESKRRILRSFIICILLL